MYTRWILLGVALSQLKAQSSAQMNCFLLTNTKACPGMGAYGKPFGYCMCVISLKFKTKTLSRPIQCQLLECRPV
jgi:hypothetical protein